MRWPRELLGDTLSKVRLATLLFAVANVLMVARPRTDLSAGHSLLCILVVLLFLADFVVTFVRRRVFWWEPVVVGPLLYGLVLTMALPPLIIGAVIGVLMTQSMYGSTRSAVVRTAAATVVMGLVIVTPAGWTAPMGGATPEPPVLLVPIFFAFLMRAIYVMLQRQEEARAREKVLARTGRRLLGVTDLENARTVVSDALDAVCALTAGLGLMVVTGGSRAVVQAVHGLPADPVGRAVPIEELAEHDSTDVLTITRLAPESSSLHATLVDLAGRRRGGWYVTGLGPGDERRWLVVGGHQRLPVGLFDVLGTLTTQLSLAEANCASVAELTRLAHHDQLTTTPNRGAFFRLLGQALEDSEGLEDGVALFLIDLDDFKQINDTLGHAAGDQVLIEIAARMSALAGRSGTASRFGGDEFALLVTGLPSAAAADELGALLRRRLLDPIHLDAETVRVGASIGLVNAIPGRGAADLMRCADIAMYSAKARGKNRVERFTAERHGDIDQVRQIEEHLAHALERGEIGVHHEPIVDLGTGRCRGVEARPCWDHPHLGVIGPEDFLPVAEREGQIVEIGAHVLRTACRHLAEWSTDEVAARLTLTVGVSVRQLADPGFDAVVAAALEDSGLAADRLLLGVAESERLHEDLLQAQLRRLSGLGVRITLDSFGGQMTALAHLRSMPLHQLTIDRRLFGDAPGTGETLDLIMSVDGFLGLETVAGGVETSKHADRARAIGITPGQGSFFAPVLADQDVLPWLRPRTPHPAQNATT